MFIYRKLRKYITDIYNSFYIQKIPKRGFIFTLERKKKIVTNLCA